MKYDPKDLTAMGSEFNPNQQNDLIEQAQEIVISDQEVQLVNIIFKQIVKYKVNWQHWLTTADHVAEYQSALAENLIKNNLTNEQAIARGINALQNDRKPFLPNPQEFCQWCKPQINEFGYTNLHALTADLLSLRSELKMNFPYLGRFNKLCRVLEKRVDWFKFDVIPEKEQYELVLESFDDLIATGFSNESDYPVNEALPTAQTVNTNLSPEQIEQRNDRLKNSEFGEIRDRLSQINKAPANKTQRPKQELQPEVTDVEKELRKKQQLDLMHKLMLAKSKQPTT